jgi:hypothetical protein
MATAAALLLLIAASRTAVPPASLNAVTNAAAPPTPHSTAPKHPMVSGVAVQIKRRVRDERTVDELQGGGGRVQLGAASYNIRTEDGGEYGRWRRVLRKQRHGLTVIAHFKSPPGKAWKNRRARLRAWRGGLHHGRRVLPPGWARSRGARHLHVNAPGAVHGGICCDLTLFIHCCSGEPDEIVSADLIDFEPKKQPGSP